MQVKKILEIIVAVRRPLTIQEMAMVLGIATSSKLPVTKEARCFLEYSVTHWPNHIRNIALTSIQKETDQMHRLYDTSGKPFLIWFPIFWKVVRPYIKNPVINALHLVVFNGYAHEVLSILKMDTSDINTPDNTEIYLVILASLNGHKKIVEILLKRGANVNIQGGRYRTTLQAACLRGYDQIVQVLLEWGAHINTQSS
ncbi:hypothetical protein N7452_002411 [Penicillium brevicompactum]|uniref:Ankyrin repeat protein n=1 Tax=Penicillium brevicompactum TaxID=5074 RepID=A0A9W9UJ05_PENBR|nr:hypothetical protein N7452_002411 [Penicillium brevicompactum]